MRLRCLGPFGQHPLRSSTDSAERPVARWSRARAICAPVARGIEPQRLLERRDRGVGLVARGLYASQCEKGGSGIRMRLHRLLGRRQCLIAPAFVEQHRALDQQRLQVRAVRRQDLIKLSIRFCRGVRQRDRGRRVGRWPSNPSSPPPPPWSVAPEVSRRDLVPSRNIEIRHGDGRFWTLGDLEDPLQIFLGVVGLLL